MKRNFILYQMLAIFCIFINMSVLKAEEKLISVRYNINIIGNILYLGDVFEGIEKFQDIEIDIAPPPGQSKIYDASYIRNLMSQYDLEDEGISVPDKIYVKRSSQIVSQDMIEDLIKQRLKPYWKDNLEVMFDIEPLEFYVDASSILPVKIHDIRYSPETGKFQTIVHFSSDTGDSFYSRIDGYLTEILQIYVPSRPIIRGEVIQKEALRLKKIPLEKIANNTLMTLDDLVGMASNKSLRIDQLIRTNDINFPKIVSRGKILNIMYKTKGLKLSLKGEALQDGIKGETIRVKNLDSQSMIFAKILNSNEALIINE